MVAGGAGSKKEGSGSSKEGVREDVGGPGARAGSRR